MFHGRCCHPYRNLDETKKCPNCLLLVLNIVAYILAGQSQVSLIERSLGIFESLICMQSLVLSDERVGQLCVVLSSPEAVMPVRSQLVAVARALWSNCPHHGARIVAMILNNPSLLQEWSV